MSAQQAAPQEAAAAAANLVVEAATAVDKVAKDVEAALKSSASASASASAAAAAAPAASASTPAIDSAAAAALKAAEAAASPINMGNLINIGSLIAAANQVSEASGLVLEAAKKLPSDEKTLKSIADIGLAATVADTLAKKALQAAAALKSTAVLAPTTNETEQNQVVKSDKDKAMKLINSLSALLAKDPPAITFAELKKALTESQLIGAPSSSGGGKMHRKKKTGISRRIRRSRVGANTRRSREFH